VKPWLINNQEFKTQIMKLMKQRTSSQFGSRFGTPAGDARMSPVRDGECGFVRGVRERGRTNKQHEFFHAKYVNEVLNDRGEYPHSLIEIYCRILHLTWQRVASRVFC
jgi:hypothetical protein